MVKTVGAGNQRLEIDLAGSNEGQGPVEDVGVAEDGFDAAFAEAGCRQVDGNRFRLLISTESWL